MSYDKELDKEVNKKVLEFDSTQLIVSIFSYDGGPSKIQIARQNNNKETGAWVFSKLGRLTKDEALSVAGALADLAAAL